MAILSMPRILTSAQAQVNDDAGPVILNITVVIAKRAGRELRDGEGVAMRFVIDENEISFLQRLARSDKPLSSFMSGFSCEMLGLVEGSYHGLKGIGTGGGSRRQFALTDAGRAFVVRLEWYASQLGEKAT